MVRFCRFPTSVFFPSFFDRCFGSVSIFIEFVVIRFEISGNILLLSNVGFFSELFRLLFWFSFNFY